MIARQAASLPEKKRQGAWFMAIGRVARRLGGMALVVIAGISLSGSVRAADDPARDYPNRPIRIIVGFSAGGGNDILARLVGQKLSADLGQPVVIENKPGAGAIIATEYVAKQPPDGYTLLIGPSGPMTINPAVYTRLGYATLRDFVPIAMVASFPLYLVVNASTPHRSVGDLVAYAKANPTKSNYASSSTAFQLPTELFKLKTGAPMEHIAYRGSGDSLVALISGTVLMAFIDAPPVSGQIKGGQVRALAVTSRARAPEFPEVPTMAEAGVPDMEVMLWSSLFAPAGTPPQIVSRLQDEVIRIVAMPDIRARMKDLAVEPAGIGSDELAGIIRSDIERWSGVAKAANIKIEP
jgi:tripartite-type tricarboxylate transporter receptor subunit TctC